MKATVAGFSLLAALLIAAPAAAAPHAPQTDAEKTLDRILRTAEGDEMILDNLVHRFPVAAAKRIDYAKWLTPKLVASLQAEQKRLLDEDCGGKYVDGDICGMDYNPLTCAQDTIRPVGTKTMRMSADSALVVRADASYRMVRTASGWQLDGIKCKDASFNFP